MNKYSLLILPVIIGFVVWYISGNFKFAVLASLVAVAVGVGLHLFRR